MRGVLIAFYTMIHHVSGVINVYNTGYFIVGVQQLDEVLASLAAAAVKFAARQREEPTIRTNAV